ncbi:hypothetical protein KCU73_g18036, partial [Aureobasidium melanogenum]
ATEYCQLVLHAVNQTKNASIKVGALLIVKHGRDIHSILNTESVGSRISSKKDVLMWI